MQRATVCTESREVTLIKNSYHTDRLDGYGNHVDEYFNDV